MTIAALFTLFLPLAAAVPPPPLALPAGAEVVQEAAPRIVCQPPWCEATLDIAASPEAIRAILMDFSRYPQVFPRVRSALPVAGGRGVQVTLGMPFPLADRDYVVEMQGDPLHFVAMPLPHPEVPGVVRLPDFAGRWHLVPSEEGEGTQVRYLWHTDLGADIPAWAVQRAWVTQGNEILLRLRDAAEGG